MKVSLIIPAAGVGRRMKSQLNKQYLLLEGKPVLAHTLERFHHIPQINEIIIVAAEDELDFCRQQVVEKYHFSKVVKIIPGGATRQDSVANGLKEISLDSDYVVIHDGARPFIKKEMVIEFLRTLETEEALVTGVPEKNTIKKVQDSYIIHTINREDVWEIQTPQGFTKEIIVTAFAQGKGNYERFTDDSSMVEEIGGKIRIFPGDYLNIKITTPEDIILGKGILEMMENEN